MGFKLTKKVAATTAPKKTAAKRVEEDDAPEPKKKKVLAGGKRKGVATEGWGGTSKVGGGGDFIQNLDFKNEAASLGDGTKWFVVKFLEGAPYANVKIHWVSERKGKKSFVCLGDDCPLCDVGADSKAEYRFNVAMLTDTEPSVRSWNAGWKVLQKIKTTAEAPLTKPLTKHFYVVSRTGKQWFEMEYHMDKVTPDEMAEAYPDLYVPSKSELAALDLYTLDEDVVKEYSTLEELEEIAAEIVEGE